MHELMLTQSILDTALRHAIEAQAARVTDLYFVVGPFSDITAESVQFYWDQISPGTLCAGARLHFEPYPARLKCRDCKFEFELPDGDRFNCPNCDSLQVQLIAGHDFRLESIAIATLDDLAKKKVDELIVEPEHEHA
jgi:hydrogenase nickel incorporation protein HypA/HybF